VPLCLKVCKLGCGSIEAPSRGEPKPGPLSPDFYSAARLREMAKIKKVPSLSFVLFMRSIAFWAKYLTQNIYFAADNEEQKSARK